MQSLCSAHPSMLPARQPVIHRVFGTTCRVPLSEAGPERVVNGYFYLLTVIDIVSVPSSPTRYRIPVRRGCQRGKVLPLRLTRRSSTPERDRRCRKCGSHRRSGYIPFCFYGGYSDRHIAHVGHYPCAARALPLWGAGPGLVRVAQLCPVRCRSLRRAVVQIPASIVSLRRHGSVYGNIQSACVNVTRRVSVGAFAQRHGGNCGRSGQSGVGFASEPPDAPSPNGTGSDASTAIGSTADLADAMAPSPPDVVTRGWLRPSETPTQEGPGGVRFDFNSGARVLLPKGEDQWKVRISDLDTWQHPLPDKNRGRTGQQLQAYPTRFGKYLVNYSCFLERYYKDRRLGQL